MSYILAENLNKAFNERVILKDVNLSIEEGDKVALIAKNGMGKSTLLNILVGKEVYDSGKITFQKGIKQAYLAQDPDLDLDKTIHEEIFASDSPMIKAVKLYEESLQNPDDQDKMQEAYELMNNNNAWEYEAKIQEILEKLKLSHLEGKISSFSGGQKKRVALAKILIDNPDFLIMDEPTNHLDLEMIDWLETYLQEQKITLLLVTHDRYFLERICNEILELDKGTLYKYKGNYSYYLEMKAAREQNENTNIDRTQALLNKELAWVKKAPRGRQTKSTARVDAYYEAKANLRDKIVNDKVKLDVATTRLGGKILEIHNLYKSYKSESGDKIILNKFSHSFTKGEKVGIIGKNGVGKTTFLNMIMGLADADAGKIVKGESVTFGYYSQDQIVLNPNQKVIDSVKSVANYMKLSDGTEITASKMLERFLFSPIVQQNLISKLSGGEKKRLNLLRILMSNPNFLILDEPTNDLDILTLNVLEEFLQNFKGCLIIITHDRYFMDKIVDHLFVFKGNGVIKDFPGNYTQYRFSDESDSKDTTADLVNVQNHPEKDQTKNDLYKKARIEANDLFREINQLEKKKETLNLKLYKQGLSYMDIAKISNDLKEVNSQIEQKTEKWLELTTD